MIYAIYMASPEDEPLVRVNARWLEHHMDADEVVTIGHHEQGPAGMRYLRTPEHGPTACEELLAIVTALREACPPGGVVTLLQAPVLVQDWHTMPLDSGSHGALGELTDDGSVSMLCWSATDTGLADMAGWLSVMGKAPQAGALTMERALTLAMCHVAPVLIWSQAEEARHEVQRPTAGASVYNVGSQAVIEACLTAGLNVHDNVTRLMETLTQPQQEVRYAD